MSRLCIVDLDGVVCDNTKRFEKAEIARDAAMPDKLVDALDLSVSRQKEINNLYWQTAFTPELVSLDTLIEGADQAMNKLMEEGYQLIYLTSRPESMSLATLAWLADHDILHRHDGGNIVALPLVMKAPAFQFVKTVTWKAGMVQTLYSLYDASEMIVVDDEIANLNEVSKWIASPQYRGFTSLAEAVEALM